MSSRSAHTVENRRRTSGECKDEFNFARRRNLTSHERGQTTDGQRRLPIIVPIAFSNLQWDKHEHVELLAASTNFLVHDAND